MTQTTIPVELIALSGEPRIAELEDIDGLMRLYKTKVFRFVAFSVTDRDAAESITQDCFLKAHLTRNQFRGDCSVNTWLMRIAFNLVRDHTKSQKFRFWKKAAATAVDAHDVSQHLASDASSAERRLIAKQQVEMVHQTLAGLSDKQRSVFVMRFVEEMDLPDIAAVTGMSLPTVKTHLYRAVGAVRARLGATL
jgi:RNA polymerase sigma-70 factor (ECF subfamily)